ncbi:MAG: DUF5808 domain-containing protein [Pseudomonadota bacterium]
MADDPWEEPQHWWLGAFYFCRHDGRLVVRKRFGSGWTFNFAQPLSWVALVALMSAVLVGPLYIFGWL